MNEMTKSRNYSVQGLRGLFALGVLLSHCFFLQDYQSSAGAFNSIIGKLANVGFFFMLSGFYAASSNPDISFKQFIIKKLKRIYPLHFLILLFMVGFRIIKSGITGKYIITALLNALLIQTWIPDVSIFNGMNGVAWFLSSLMFCYIAGFYLVKRFNRNSKAAKKELLFLIAILFTIKIVGAIIWPNDNRFGYWLTYINPLAGFADFLLGFLLSFWVKEKDNTEKMTTIMQIVALVLMIVMFLTKHYLPTNYSRAFYSTPFNFILILAFSNETKFSRCIFGNRIMRFLGDLSFEIYLIHSVIIAELISRISIFNNISIRISPYLSVLIIIAIVVACAFIYKIFYEKFSQKLVDRMFQTFVK